MIDMFSDVEAVTVRVRRRVAGLVDAAVDAPAEMLDEAAEQPTVDFPQFHSWVDHRQCRRCRPVLPRHEPTGTSTEAKELGGMSRTRISPAGDSVNSLSAALCTPGTG